MGSCFVDVLTSVCVTGVLGGSKGPLKAHPREYLSTSELCRLLWSPRNRYNNDRLDSSTDPRRLPFLPILCSLSRLEVGVTFPSGGLRQWFRVPKEFLAEVSGSDPKVRVLPPSSPVAVVG